MAALFGGDVEGLFAAHSPASVSAHSSAAADDGSSFHASVAHRPQIPPVSAAASADRSSSAAFGSMEHYMYCDDGARDGEVDVLPYDIYFKNSGFSFNVPVVDSQAVTEDVDGKKCVASDGAVFKGKQNHKKRNVESPRSSSSGAAVTDTKDFVVVRARRGQATDRHSIAERARREKIRKRMNYLQELVPGCCKSGAGKTVILDEIINYVKSLQNQVEFLSMKLSAATAGYDFGTGTGVDGCGAAFSEIPYVAPITSTGDVVFGGASTNIASEPFLDSETSIEYGGDRFSYQPQVPSLY